MVGGSRLLQFVSMVGVVLLAVPALGASLYPVPYPGDGPAGAVARQDGGTFELCNVPIGAVWRVSVDRLELDVAGLKSSQIPARSRARTLFSLTLADGTLLTDRDFRLDGGPKLVRLEASPEARRLVERFDGHALEATFISRDGALRVGYRATLRDESNYLIQRVALQAVEADVAITQIGLIDLDVAGAEVAGVTQGTPVVADTMFFAYEHPMAESRVEGDRVTCVLKGDLTLTAGAPLVQTAVIGVTPQGQLRRAFLYYIERERAHPFRPFLHYNSWYDISWGDRRFDEAQALEAIDIYGRELVLKRGVVMDSFAFDDGWDDHETLWQFHDGFPNGFRPLHEAASRHGASVGAWLSPFGGYGTAREKRLAYGREQGYETNEGGFSLAGARYYERFLSICTEMMREYGVDFFKYDGMGTGGRASAEGGGAFMDDIEALMRLVDALREIKPDLYVSATTGTWCSPYFLWHADSIWRGEGDMGFHGKGSRRQRWITYRDAFTYKNVVKQGPLYPLNSLMNQGVVQARHGSAALLGDDLKEMADEFWSFFGSGTGLQELYIAPGLLNDAQWDILAEAARWGRANAGLFVDTHWVGGDPGAREVYGWASWMPWKGILVLRNPSAKKQTIKLDIGKALEVPSGAAQRFRVASPRPDQRKMREVVLSADSIETYRLDPFEVLVYDLIPVPR